MYVISRFDCTGMTSVLIDPIFREIFNGLSKVTTGLQGNIYNDCVQGSVVETELYSSTAWSESVSSAPTRQPSGGGTPQILGNQLSVV